jgi:outer membrane biosynthesis protein TonB
MKTGVKRSPNKAAALKPDLLPVDKFESPVLEFQPLDRPDRRSRRWRPPWWFLAGVLLGWLVIGWWLWPVQWTDAAPWRLSPQHQRVYVSLIANDYSQSANVATVTQALTGWNRNDLSNLLATMQQETSDPLTQQHLANLIAVLQLPGSEATLSASLAGQPGIVLGLAVSAVPLLAALALIIVNLAQRQKSARDEFFLQSGQRVTGDESVAGEAADLLDEAAPQDWQIQPKDADQQAQAEQAGPAAEVVGGRQQPAEQAQPQSAEQPQQPVQSARPASDQPAEQAQPVKAAAQPGQSPKAEENKSAEQSSEQAEPAKSELSDVLSLFEEEQDATLSGLGTLAKDLIEVNVDELLDLGTHMLRRFHRGERQEETVAELTS